MSLETVLQGRIGGVCRQGYKAGETYLWGYVPPDCRCFLAGSKQQPPNLGDHKGNYKPEGERQQRGHGRPFFTARFFEDGIDGGGAGIVDEREKHYANSREQGPSTR